MKIFATNLNFDIFKYIYSYLLSLQWCKPFIFKTLNIWSNRIKSLKYLRLGCKDVGIRKSDFVAKTEFLPRDTVSKGLRFSSNNLRCCSTIVMRYSGILIYQGRKVVSVMLHNFDHINEDLQIISDVSLQKDQSRIRIMNFFIFIGKFICCSTLFKRIKRFTEKAEKKDFCWRQY